MQHRPLEPQSERAGRRSRKNRPLPRKGGEPPTRHSPAKRDDGADEGEGVPRDCEPLTLTLSLSRGEGGVTGMLLSDRRASSLHSRFVAEGGDLYPLVTNTL